MDGAAPGPNLPRSLELLRKWLEHGGDIALPALGGSMAPTLLTGDRLRVEHVRPEDVRAGDVIVFHSLGRLVGHRVVRLSVADRTFVTEGDRSGIDIEPVPWSQLIGRVSSRKPGPGALRQRSHPSVKAARLAARVLLQLVVWLGNRLVRGGNGGDRKE